MPGRGRTGSGVGPGPEPGAGAAQRLPSCPRPGYSTTPPCSPRFGAPQPERPCNPAKPGRPRLPSRPRPGHAAAQARERVQISEFTGPGTGRPAVGRGKRPRPPATSRPWTDPSAKGLRQPQPYQSLASLCHQPDPSQSSWHPFCRCTSPQTGQPRTIQPASHGAGLRLRTRTTCGGAPPAACQAVQGRLSVARPFLAAAATGLEKSSPQLTRRKEREVESVGAGEDQVGEWWCWGWWGGSP